MMVLGQIFDNRSICIIMYNNSGALYAPYKLVVPFKN